MNTRKRSADEKLAVQATDYDYKRCNRCGPCRKKKGLKCETPRKVLRAASTAPNSADGSSMRPPPSQRRNQSSTRNKKAKHSRERCMRCTPCLRKKGDPCANFKARQHEISKDHPDYEMNRKYPLVTLVSSGKYFCDPSFPIPLREEDVAVHMSAEYFMKHPGGEERRAAAAEEAALCWRRAQHEAPEGVRLYNTLSFRWHGFELAPPRPPEGAPPPDDSPPAAAATAAKVTLQLGLTDARSNIWVRYADPQRLTAALAAASGGAPGAGLGRPLGLEVLILTRDGFFLTVRERGGGGGGGGGGGNGGTGREAAPQGLHGVVGQPEPVGAGLVRADLARPSPARLAGASSSAAPPAPSGPRGGGGGGGKGAAARELFEAPRRLAVEQTGLPRALLGSPRLLGAAHLTHGPRCGAALLAFLLPTPLSQAQAQRRFQRHAQEQAWRFEQRRQAVWVRARDALRRQRHFRQLRLGAGAEAALGLWRRAEQLRLDKMAAAAPRAAYELPPPDCPEPDMDEDIRPEQALRSRLPGQKVCLVGANGTPKEKSDAEEEGGGGEGGLAGDIDETEEEVARITAQDDVKPGEEATVGANHSGETPSPSSEMGAEKEHEGGNAEPMGNDEDEMEDEEEEDEEQEKLDVNAEDEVESTQQGEEDEEEDDDVDEELLREIEKVAAAEGLNDEENDNDEDEEMLDEEDEEEEEEEEEEEDSYTGEPANDIIQSKNQGIYSDVEEEEDASVRSAEQEGNGEPTAAEEASGVDDLSEEVEDEEVGGYLDEEEEEEEEEAGVSPTEEGDGGGEVGYGGESTDGAGSLPPSAQKESAGRRSRVGGNDAASDDEGEEEDDDEEEEDL